MAKRDETSIHSNVNLTAGLNGKTVTGCDAYVRGNVDIVEITYASGASFIKFKHGQIEIGGNADWDTGTKIA